MRRLVRFGLALMLCVGITTAALYWLTGPDGRTRRRPGSGLLTKGPAAPGTPAPAVQGKSEEVWIDNRHFEDGGVGLANDFSGPVRDETSLEELRKSVLVRGRLGLSVMRAELALAQTGLGASPEQLLQAIGLHRSIGLLALYEGRFAEASAEFEKAEGLAARPGLPGRAKGEMRVLRGLAALRRGEEDNCIACLGPTSCIFPIDAAAAHRQQEGSREALAHFKAYLDEHPGDLRVEWLASVAAMTLGEYPSAVPARYVVPLDRFASKGDVGRFENVAPKAGLIGHGPNQAGGSVFDDFNGDGLPDLFTTSLDADRGASIYINRGDGTFEDRTAAAGLDDQVYALNCVRGDFDNDGNLDVVLLRGAWEKPMRPTLLRNRGNGTFEDVTVAAGIALPISSETAAWGDYDDDGDLDLFLGGEYLPPFGDLTNHVPDPRNLSRLYRNKGNGTFEDVARASGLVNEQCAKGSAWGDYDGDGRLDLYVSNMNGPSRLYHNEGEGKFRDVAPELGVTGADVSFACWFWDYDNDGRLDLYVHENLASLAETTAWAMHLPTPRTSRPRVYHNEGGTFRETTQELGLDLPLTPMGCNFGDVDSDGFLDVYVGTGGMSYEYLVPNMLFRNDDGKQFLDVTTSSGTGHLQKGHGVSFADYDDDGDLDFFVELGGAVPGDRAHNVLFQNPGNGRHWLKVKLVGKATNRIALGARINAVVMGPDGKPRTIHRTIGNNSSFGGNSLVEFFGLRDAGEVVELEVSWPTSKTSQAFRGVKADQTVVITEGANEFRPLPPRPRSAGLR
ncbi:MAG: FG-GAP-like repeat-containing protein [Isosphaeraceae bacterium]